jgi:hypothetical protein
MKSFKTFLLESGGRNIMGVNPLQMKSRDILRFIGKWKKHVSIDSTTNHHRLLDSNGNIITTFTMGELGPKSALGVISKLRDHLVSKGVYVVQPNERSSLTPKRKNTRVEDGKESQTDKKPREEVIKAIVDRLKSGSIGQRKRRRLERIVSKERQ